MMHIDTRSLISEVQKRPQLWNPSTREYRLRDARMASWLDICAKLIKNFDALDIRAQDKIVLKIRTRWKTARDTFMKINNNLKGRTKKASRYYYFEQLQFLRQVKQRKRPQFTPKVKKNEEGSLEETARTNASDRSETPEIKEEEAPVIKIEDDLNDDEMSTCELTAAATGNDKSKKQAAEKEIEKDDSDCAFLRSLLPILRKFDDNQKLNFRVDMLRIIMRLRNSQRPDTLAPFT